MRVATWNLEWAKPGTQRHTRCIDQLESVDADVVVTTEHSLVDWGTYPYRVDAGPDWGYPIVEGRRKVIAWSKTPWDTVSIAQDGASRGRLLSAITTVDDATFTLIGVCIPWRDAHVRTGRRDRAIWDEHRDFLDPLKSTIARVADGSPTVVAGDFNQQFPRSRQPVAIHDDLVLALSGVRVVTDGEFECGKLIDHVAVSDGVRVSAVEAWSNVIGGHRLTDHSGVVVSMSSTE